ncbi:MAG TPA: HAD-IA family hydrolase [Pseudoduganella sp.]|jgi:phosphoglycolate phosphatase
MKNPPRAILFDLDGTLADTAPDLAAAVNRLRTDHGLPPLPYEPLRAVASNGESGLIGAAFNLATNDAGYEKLCAAFLDHYGCAIATKTRLFDGIAPLLRTLTEKGLKWGIVTNKVARFSDLLVPQIGLHDAACVISGDTMPHAKPHPAPLLEAARRLALPPQDCWYVGDDLRDIQAGQAAGMTTIAAAWGYCGIAAPFTWHADAVVDLPLDILALLDQAHENAPPRKRAPETPFLSSM